MLPGDGLVRVDVGAILNLLFRQRHIQSLGMPVRMDYGKWRDQHSPAAKPAAGIDNEVADGPCFIVEIELIYGSKLAVRSSDHKTFQVCEYFLTLVFALRAVIECAIASRCDCSGECSVHS